MTGKPTLKTGRLICPSQEAITPLRRVHGREAGPGYAGLPDDKSPAQRTLHQSLLNRRIGASHIYTTLRDYGFTIRWGHQPGNMPEAGLALSLCHDGGPMLGIILRTESTRNPCENDLLQQGWHLLVLDPSAVVQTPQDGLDTLLEAMRYLGCQDLPSVDRGGETHALIPNSLLRPIGRPLPVYERLWRIVRLPVLGGALAACLALGVRLNADPETVTANWPSGMAIRAKIASVAMSPDGNALLALANGSKAFIPASALQRNPERLHRLIVAWRQGRPLTLFSTSTEHQQYGRKIGIRDGLRHKPAAGKGTAPSS